MPKQVGVLNTTPARREAMLNLTQTNLYEHEIAAAFKCSTRTIQWVLKKQANLGHVNDLPRSGRPRKIDARGLRSLKHSLDGNRHQTLADITRNLNTSSSTPVAPRTVQRALHRDLGMYSRHACKKPFLTNEHKKRRLKWARAAIHYDKDEWHRVIWTDESSVELGKNSKAALVW